jgi:hypothetical protein
MYEIQLVQVEMLTPAILQVQETLIQQVAEMLTQATIQLVQAVMQIPAVDVKIQHPETHQEMLHPEILLEMHQVILPETLIAAEITSEI